MHPNSILAYQHNRQRGQLKMSLNILESISRSPVFTEENQKLATEGWACVLVLLENSEKAVLGPLAGETGTCP